MQQIKNILKIIAFIMIPLIPVSSQATEENRKELIFGVHPYLHASILVERFTPLTEYLSSKLGQKVLIRVGSDYNDHVEAIKNGKVDFAFLGPALLIKLTRDSNDFQPLGRLSFSGKDSFRGAIITRTESNIDSLKDLKGKQFAFGDPNSTLSSLLPLRLLNDAGITLADLAGYSNLKNHHNVALSVLLGKHDAGGVKEEVLREYESRGLKAIQWSPEIPTHLFVARQGLSQTKIVALSSLLQNLHKQPASTNILQNIKKGTTAIIPAQIEEYAELRKLISPLLINLQQ
ncbi:MAG: phosphate/phosphite/phosphonate ABC transporter substrate-binding protein [Gammaproteobacteria bacterium]|jgi:phosphonate transport system substrate-binding protein|nr:phosphate/phosphite/phosphonate ABC transporter substrate-binding protein [Gammaproteobacteria bacterium]MBT3723654.1 phosphate/phosphite/phosphonate ABC transporter substrate-binding protein [Gammaproteobacteria bacterium]MBT4077264.1 phosphate/phosphite/phosphonate ABC transporter substrate-binding protein [Gammaproteobacteria bacterium]MBT4194115.1 phosphate/phosphite/phosphonate ABC transporter substrate-binding protein [Gammaproteobacteria bacterium]MBT4450657.1 phosphate/phosphite/phos